MSRDPYRYFRVEAGEIVEGLSTGALSLEKEGATPDRVARLLRLAHTLKGAARVVKQTEMADAAHHVEDLLAPHREAAGPVARETVADLLGAIDLLSARLAALSPAAAAAPAGHASFDRAVDAPAAAPAPAPAAAAHPPLAIAETIRVDIAELDALLENVSETAMRLAALRQAAASSTGGLLPGLEAAEREMQQVQERTARLRLVSADTIFAPLARAVRDAAQLLGRDVGFTTAGGDVRLDAHVLAAVREALLHVVRNAVAHGIEPASQRAAAGKAAEGRIELRVERRGRFAAFRCRDDGAGLDVEAVAQAAKARGMLAADARIDQAAAAALVLRPGLSTSRELNAIAGRGVGLDVVQDVASRFKGEARITSERGRGLTVELTVPVSLASVSALGVEAGGRIAWVPLDAVVRTLHLGTADVSAAGQGQTVGHEGTAMALVPLAAVVPDSFGPVRRAQGGAAVVLEADGVRAAIAVDRLHGVRQVVLRTLPAAAGTIPALAGATLDSAGRPQLVLDAAGLVARVASVPVGAPAAALRARPPILVIDDSLTTRMLEQSILETAGYEVDLAVSGEEGLRQAHERRYGLFLVDVEMPGMNGFEFIARARADPELAHVPSILVTSLDSEADRARGVQAGAYAHVVKGQFDDRRLRALIEELLG
jgi:two-component system chemotaxis sensor kinase CheA